MTSVNLAHMHNLVGTKGVSSGRQVEVDTFCVFFIILVTRALLQFTMKCVAQRPMHQNTCFRGGHIPFRSIGL